MSAWLVWFVLVPTDSPRICTNNDNYTNLSPSLMQISYWLQDVSLFKIIMKYYIMSMTLEITLNAFLTLLKNIDNQPKVQIHTQLKLTEQSTNPCQNLLELNAWTIFHFGRICARDYLMYCSYLTYERLILWDLRPNHVMLRL